MKRKLNRNGHLQRAGMVETRRKPYGKWVAEGKAKGSPPSSRTVWPALKVGNVLAFLHEISLIKG